MPGARAAVSLSRGIRKNGDCRMNRAENISSTPAMTMPTSDQTWDDGALSSDLARIQPRNTAAPSGSRPRISASQALLNTRRR